MAEPTPMSPRSPAGAAPPGAGADLGDDFVLALLTALKADSYRPRAWLRFLGEAWEQSAACAGAHPRLAASWAGVAAGLTLAQTGALALTASQAGDKSAMRTALALAPLHLWTLTDTWAHLGMNAARRGDAPAETLGLPNALTLLRRGVADHLAARLLVGAPAPAPLALGALLIAGATDIADGAVARGTGRQSRLGAYLDATADLGFWLALALTLALTRRLPGWLAGLLAVRFLAPLAFALAAYFGLLARLPIGSTRLGKAAGVAQALVFAEAVAPERLRGRLSPIRAPLRLLTGALLILAPLSQLLRLRQAR